MYNLFYFSAHWCGPCKKFTPLLIEFYEYCKLHHPNLLEITFISLDHNEKDYLEYASKMPWLIEPFENCDELSNAQKITSIPSLRVFNRATGSLIDKYGTDTVRDCNKDWDSCLQKWSKSS